LPGGLPRLAGLGGLEPLVLDRDGAARRRSRRDGLRAHVDRHLGAAVDVGAPVAPALGAARPPLSETQLLAALAVGEGVPVPGDLVELALEGAGGARGVLAHAALP